ncbi:hypothetical protein [Spongiimicrobium salis]|uniref:hypothetical protein n=1 Tax=Spongiimicrobium salis TaxID=1667022 RepID=UPI00374D0D55
MKKFFKILLKTLVGLIGVFLLVFVVLYLIYNESVPEMKPSPEADMYANKMLNALNYDSYKQTRFLEWSFRNGAHRYLWDKENGRVKVSWSTYEVNLHLTNKTYSTVFKNGIVVKGKEKNRLITKATTLFNNDSFWLVAPFKIFDKGTERSIITMKDGSRGLLVHYLEGGDTPGDVYLWRLNQDGTPKSYQMWAKIIPIGGIEATWEEWTEMESGILLPQSHDLGPLTLDMGAIKAYN